MTKLSTSFLALIAIFAALPVTAYAAPGAVVLKGDVKVETTVVEKGVERIVLAAPKVVVPGNRLLFSTSYRNESAAPVQNFVVTNPVPEGIAVAAPDAASLTVSVDGGKTWGKLGALRTATPTATTSAICGSISTTPRPARSVRTTRAIPW